MFTAAHHCYHLLPLFLCVSSLSDLSLPFSIFEPTNAESPVLGTPTPTHAPWMLTFPTSAPFPRLVCMTGAWQW